MSLSQPIQVRRLNATVAICFFIPVRRYRLINVYTLMILKNWTGSAGTEESFKNVRYSTINDENKYKSKDYLFICFQTTIMLNKREKKLLYNFYFRQTAILFIYLFYFILFYLFPFTLLFFSLTFFVLSF